jgi:hypothetical protein
VLTPVYISCTWRRYLQHLAAFSTPWGLFRHNCKYLCA